MAFFKLKVRCPYCGRKVDSEGYCINPRCIEYGNKVKDEGNEDIPHEKGDD